MFIATCTDDSWGSALLTYTGSLNFKQRMCAHAREEGLMLSPYGLYRGKERIAGKTERQVFATLGVPFIRPKDRGNLKYPVKWKKGEKMRKEAATERQRVYYAIDLIMAQRKKGSVPASRDEICEQTMMPRDIVENSLQWLKRQKLVLQGKGKGEKLKRRGWLPRPLPVEGICWIHAKSLPCRTCIRNGKD